MKFLKCGTKSKKKYYSFPKKKKPLVTLPLLQKVDEIQNHLRKYLPSSSISWRDWGKKCIQNVSNQFLIEIVNVCLIHSKNLCPWEPI